MELKCQITMVYVIVVLNYGFLGCLGIVTLMVVYDHLGPKQDVLAP